MPSPLRRRRMVGIRTTGSALKFSQAQAQGASINSSVTFQPGNTDFTLAVRFKLTTKTPASNEFVAGKFDGGSAGAEEYGLYMDNGNDRFRFVVTNGVGVGQAFSNNLGSPSAGVWYVATCTHDSVNDLVGLRVNAAAQDTDPYASGAQTTTAKFRVGIDNGDIWALDGVVDWVGWWKGRVLSAGDHTLLVNGGATLTFAALDASLLTTLTEWWDFSETASPSVGAVAASNLTWINNPTPVRF
jgi:hypothetical protein